MTRFNRRPQHRGRPLLNSHGQRPIGMMMYKTNDAKTTEAGLWAGHAANRDFAPVPVASLLGVITVFAVVVSAESQAEAAAKLTRWHEIGDELHPLESLSGHTHCTPACNCASSIRDAKSRLRAERLAICPND